MDQREVPEYPDLDVVCLKIGERTGLGDEVQELLPVAEHQVRQGSGVVLSDQDPSS